MADVVNVKINQSIKGNKFQGKASIRQKFRMRLVVPADIVINIKAKNKGKEPEKETPVTKEKETSNDK